MRSPQINFVTEQDRVRVTYRGDVVYQATSEAIRKAAQIAAERQIRKLLFDIREANYDDYYLDTIRHVEEGPSLGVDKTFRVAFLGAKEQYVMLQFIENASVNRGYEAKVFTDESEAVAWMNVRAV